MSRRPPVLHPLVAEWFTRRFTAATEAQRQAWTAIHAGQDVLISAPTGSGKTLAAFLICLDRLVRQALDGSLDDRIEVVYVSPLKALSNDIHKNLEVPLTEIAALAAETGTLLPPLRSGVRTGDTPAWVRQQMVRRPPHILVTTPESLFILLTADRSRHALRQARTVIVDEIHAVADDKRGAHLALSLARLDDLVAKAGGAPLQRIGLSATVSPIQEVARFLRPMPADGSRAAVHIIDSGHRRALDLAVEVPKDELGAVATHEMWDEIYDRMAELIRAHRATLVFVNTRRLAERVAHHLGERLGADAVLAHHGSLAQRLRLKAEQRLKSGELRAVVATASLELGIDIGFVDLVCQVGSSRSIAVALQRVGRAGHHVDRPGRRVIPKGRLFATTRDDLVECAALVHAIRSGTLDRLEIPPWPIDILAQQIVAAAACESWPEDALFDLVRGAHPYRELPRPAFDAAVQMLSEGITTRRGRSGALLHRDRVNRIVRGRRGARLAALTSGGAIPDNASYPVVAEPEGTRVGSVDEDFAVESLAGDVFLLGTTSWRIRRVEAGLVRVEDAHGAAPSVPFWRGEAPGRTHELSRSVSDVRREVATRIEHAPDGSALAFVMDDCGLDRAGAEQVVAYVVAGSAALEALPTATTVVAERFFDESGGMQLVLHAPFGARINRAWGLSLRKRFCRTFNFELQAAATDNGILISLSDQHSFPLEVIFRFLTADTVTDVLTQAQLDSPMFTARWRWNVSRALAVLRFAGGRKVPPPIQRMRSDDLLAAVFPDQVACAENLAGEIRIPEHPLVDETIRDCLHEAMDVEGLKTVLRGIDDGKIRTVAIDTAEPSPFSHEILNANPYAFLDDAPLEERRARAVQMRRTLGPADEIGLLDPAAIGQVAADSWPIVRDADELHDALLTLVALPPVLDWQGFFDTLETHQRATTLVEGTTRLWVAAERLALARRAYPTARLDPDIVAVGDTEGPDGEAAATEVVRGWMECSAPVTAATLVERLGLPPDRVDAALASLEAEGQILRGRFTPPDASNVRVVEWCNRRLLARIHRLTLGRLRREIEPVTAAQLVAYLFRWQHVAPGTQLHGADGLRAIIGQLQGYEISAAAWEPDVLRRRVAGFEPHLLDELCLSGEVVWGRLSRHPAFDEPPAGEAPTDGRARRGRRVRPTRVAPVALWLRDDASWILPGVASGGPRPTTHASLSHAGAAVLAQLKRRGASFLPELVRATGRLTSEVEDALWELVAAGLVTADGFDNLRALADPKRRRGEGRGRTGRPRHAAGRWALLRPDGHDGPAGHADNDALESEDIGRGRARAAPERVEAFARQLLRRWGVVFRDLVARESLAPPWRELLGTLRRLEARGEIRGGALRRRLRRRAVRPAGGDRAAAGGAPRGLDGQPLGGGGCRSPEPRRYRHAGATRGCLGRQRDRHPDRPAGSRAPPSPGRPGSATACSGPETRRAATPAPAAHGSLGAMTSRLQVHRAPGHRPPPLDKLERLEREVRCVCP